MKLTYWFNNKFTPNQVSELANTQYQLLFTSLTHNDPEINPVN